MTDGDPLRRAARVARKVPGYRYFRRIVVPKLRQSPAARALAYRVFAVDTGRKPSSGMQNDVTAGSLLAGIGLERLPVVLLVLIGTPGHRIGEVVEEVARLQVLGAAFRPVFAIDSPTFAPIRRFGYLVELVTPSDSWTADEPWSEYAGRRLASMISAYGIRAVVTVGSDGLGDGGRATLASFG